MYPSGTREVARAIFFDLCMNRIELPRKEKRMDRDEQAIVERLEAATSLLERTLGWLEERQTTLAGEVEKISATVEQSRREAELEQRLLAAEQELQTLKAGVPNVIQRKTLPASTSELLAKRGITDGGPIDVRTLDIALTGLSLEQRIAVKTQLQRAGGIA